MPQVKKVLDEHPEGAVKLHEKKNLVVMEGPAFSTRAESLMYRQWGVSLSRNNAFTYAADRPLIFDDADLQGDIINMSTIPEAKLAREAELRSVNLARVVLGN